MSPPHQRRFLLPAVCQRCGDMKATWCALKRSSFMVLLGTRSERDAASFCSITPCRRCNASTTGAFICARIFSRALLTFASSGWNRISERLLTQLLVPELRRNSRGTVTPEQCCSRFSVPNRISCVSVRTAPPTYILSVA